MILTRSEAAVQMNRLVDSATRALEEAAALGQTWGIPFQYDLSGTVDEPQWEPSDDYWSSSSC